MHMKVAHGKAQESSIYHQRFVCS
uniref:Uncharacterized protein n=1 Tax=Nelumbo nucifera TaxID=4432 RepID=A0A822YLQ6_NELNU|nr:TPA_asm: hypothetical protein HUJ06_012313 [Nelumbo nucifera]